VPAQPGKRPAGTPQRIEFVDEDDGRRRLAGLLKQVAHPRRAHPHEHLHELRTADGEKRHPGFPRQRPRQQGLARTRRSHQEHAFGNPGAELAVARRVFEKRQNLLQFGLGLVHAGHILEADPGVAFDIDLGLAATNGHHAALALSQPGQQEGPEQHQDGNGNEPGEDFPDPGIVHRAGEAHA